MVGTCLVYLRRVDYFFIVPIPETASAEAFERYVGGKRLRTCRGKAWRDVKAWSVA